MPSAPRFRSDGVHVRRCRTNPTGDAGGFGSTPKPPADVDLQLLAPRPTGPVGSFLLSALGRQFSRRLPGLEEFVLRFTPICHVVSPPTHSTRLLHSYSSKSDLRSLSRDITYCLRRITPRSRSHIEIRGPDTSSLPTDPPQPPPPDCQKIPLRPILRHCGFTLTKASQLGGHAVLRHLKEDACSDPHEVIHDFFHRPIAEASIPWLNAIRQPGIACCLCSRFLVFRGRLLLPRACSPGPPPCGPPPCGPPHFAGASPATPPAQCGC